MKLLFFQIFLLLTLLFSARKTLAQQPKAYETVKYAARTKNTVFYLDYAGGYIGASKIWLAEASHKKRLFLPESGAVKPNGNFVLHTSIAADKSEVVLTRISEQFEAPETIPAYFRQNGHTMKLLFRRTGS